MRLQNFAFWIGILFLWVMATITVWAMAKKADIKEELVKNCNVAKEELLDVDIGLRPLKKLQKKCNMENELFRLCNIEPSSVSYDKRQELLSSCMEKVNFNKEVNI